MPQGPIDDRVAFTKERFDHALRSALSGIDQTERAMKLALNLLHLVVIMG